MSNQGLLANRARGYLGVKAGNPPNLLINDRDPTTTDYFNHKIGDIWVNQGTTSAPVLRVWILVRQAAHIATWILFINGGGGPVVGLQPAINGVPNGAVVNPLLGIIQINNTDANIIPIAGVPNPNNLNINLANNITIPGNFTTTGGNVIANAGTVQGQFVVANIGLNTLNGDATIANNNATIDGANINFSKSRLGGALLPGDQVGTLNYIGYEGGPLPIAPAGAIRVSVPVTATIAHNRVAGVMTFYTHPDVVAVSATARMIIYQDGAIQVTKADAGSTLVNSFSSLGNIASGGDDGAGLAAYTSLTNASSVAAVGVNTLVGVAGGAVNQGYLKLYLGVTPIYVPYFTNP